MGPGGTGRAARRALVGGAAARRRDVATFEPKRYTGVHPFSEDETDERDRVRGDGCATSWTSTRPTPRSPRERTSSCLRTPCSRSRPPWRGVGLVVVTVVGSVPLALLLVPLVKLLRRGRRRRTSSWSGVYVNAWQEVLDAARDRGTLVPDAWSRRAQARRLGAGLDLSRRADAAVFAPQPSSAEDGREFWGACQELRRRLVTESGARHCWWTRVNPASLLAGWARRRTRDGSAARQVRHEDRGPRREQPAGA